MSKSANLDVQHVESDLFKGIKDHPNDLHNVFQELTQLRTLDGPSKFKTDLEKINKDLHDLFKKGLLPDLQLVDDPTSADQFKLNPLDATNPTKNPRQLTPPVHDNVSGGSDQGSGGGGGGSGGGGGGGGGGSDGGGGGGGSGGGGSDSGNGGASPGIDSNAVSTGGDANPVHATPISGIAYDGPPQGNSMPAIPDGQHKKLIDQALKLAGQPVTAANEAAVDLIVSHESTWRPDAQNNTDSNAQKGIPSRGLMQTIGPTFKQWAVQGHNHIDNPVDNMAAGIRYAVGTYGSLQNTPGVKSVHSGGGYKPY